MNILKCKISLKNILRKKSLIKFLFFLESFKINKTFYFPFLVDKCETILLLLEKG